MKDPRNAKLANVLLNHSIKVKPGENVLISAHTLAKPLVLELIKKVHTMGAFPITRLRDPEVTRLTQRAMTEEMAKRMYEGDIEMYKRVDKFLSIYSDENVFETSDVPAKGLELWAGKYWEPMRDQMPAIKNNGWVVLNYPNSAMAQMAKMSTEAFEKYYFKVCTMDYAKMGKAMEPLKEMMDKAERVKILGADTDLTFSIKGNIAEQCDGSCNIPDGEVFSAPVPESVNGKIVFDIPTEYRGVMHKDIALTFKGGKAIKATSNDTKALNKVLDSDTGARYTGEFAFGLHPLITKPMGDILFDEKIGGSMHMAMGDAYPETVGAGNTLNKSQVHWDMIRSGKDTEIYLDDTLVRKNGKFTLPNLEPLDHLI